MSFQIPPFLMNDPLHASSYDLMMKTLRCAPSIRQGLIFAACTCVKNVNKEHAIIPCILQDGFVQNTNGEITGVEVATNYDKTFSFAGF